MLRAQSPLRHAPTSLVLCSFALSACICDPDLVVVAPQVYADVCRDPKLELNGKLLGGVRDCSLVFEDTPVSVRTRHEIRLTNPSPVPLRIFSAEFTSNSDPAFEVELIPEEIREGQTAVGIVSYRPLVDGTQTGTLIIDSDAQNLAEDEKVVIDVSGGAFDGGLPNIVVNPLECDYGRVAIDGVAQCTLTIENTGRRDLVFDSVRFDEEALVAPAEHPAAEVPFSFVGRPPARDDALGPAGGDASSVFDLTLRFVPLALGNYQGLVVIRSNDPDSPEIAVPLNGVGVTPPTCDVRVKTVNGLALSADNSIEPLDDVILTADSSEPATPNGSITSVRWRIMDAPPGSTAILTNPSGTDTGFTFADGVLGVDLAGRYRIRATVIDDLGTESVNQCEIEFEAVPTDTILTQLTWDTSFGDMDLHLLKMTPGNEFCGTSGLAYGDTSRARGCGTTWSCYYGNCKATSSSRPDWDLDGVSGSPGDPSLDIDDQCGFGPENITIDTAEPGQYLVGVDFYGFTGCSGSGSVGNTIRLYLFGQLQAEFFKDLVNGDWWEVAIIHWPGVGQGSPCIEDLSTPEQECG
jgi:hypothetical protein